MISSKPFALGSNIFDRLHINLSITSKTTNGVFSGSTCVTLKPYTELPDGTEEFAPRDYETVVIIADNVSQSMVDPVTAEAMNAISGAIQTYITKKGL